MSSVCVPRPAKRQHGKNPLFFYSYHLSSTSQFLLYWTKLQKQYTVYIKKDTYKQTNVILLLFLITKKEHVLYIFDLFLTSTVNCKVLLSLCKDTTLNTCPGSADVFWSPVSDDFRAPKKTVGFIYQPCVVTCADVSAGIIMRLWFMTMLAHDSAGLGKRDGSDQLSLACSVPDFSCFTVFGQWGWRREQKPEKRRNLSGAWGRSPLVWGGGWTRTCIWRREKHSRESPEIQSVMTETTSGHRLGLSQIL